MPTRENLEHLRSWQVHIKDSEEIVQSLEARGVSTDTAFLLLETNQLSHRLREIVDGLAEIKDILLRHSLVVEEDVLGGDEWKYPLIEEEE